VLRGAGLKGKGGAKGLGFGFFNSFSFKTFQT
jgi:hypothetical protein